MPKKKILNKPLSPMQLGMRAMPSWFHPPTLIPLNKKYIKLVELGINTKSTWDYGGVLHRAPKL